MKDGPGRKMDTSETDYVECVGCHRRFVGGDLESRLARFAAHDCPNDSPEAQAMATDPTLARLLA